jgi:hypothetical protein
MARQIDIDLDGNPIISGTTLSVPEHDAAIQYVTNAQLAALDYVMYSLDYDTDQTTAPLNLVWPPGYPYAQIIYQNTNGTYAELNVLAIYDSVNSYTLTSTKQECPDLPGLAVSFMCMINDGTIADFMVKFTKD